MEFPVPPPAPIKAVNLGGWLVAEGWIEPSLFDGIPNNDLLDGTQVQLKSAFLGKYVVAEQGGGSILAANRSVASGWETFKLWRVDSTRFQLRVFFKQFVGVNAGGQAVASTATPGPGETFEIVRSAGDPNRVRFRASNGLFLQAKTENSVTADSGGNGSWGNDDPSVFLMRVFGNMRGEYQVTNGYGRHRAPAIMRAHWASFIVEDDFKFIKDNGLNAVRIPVGWWIASDPSPPSPYVGGSLAVLDDAFSWADKYGLKVIIDLHAAPGSQNGDEHSGGRDGYIEWGSGNTVAQTVAVIDFLAQRYAKRPSLIAVELINEPRAEGVSFDTLKNYYQAGYDAVRKHTSSAYVIFSSRLSADAGEFISFAGGLDRTVLDVHYYNLFSSFYDGWTPQRHIDYVNTERSQQLSAVTRANGGPLSFVGEWVAEWNVPNASPEDFQRFAKAQLDLFSKATFGWAYWTYKNVNNHWSLKWMITNGYIKFPVPPPAPIKAVNLGGWLVTEGWIEPSLFDGIPNNDLLDGTQVQLKSAFLGKYVVAEQGGGSILAANRSSASGWETFKLWRVDSTRFQLRVFFKQFVGVNAGGQAVASTATPGPGETFEIVRSAGDPNRVRFRASNGLFLQAKTENSVTADSGGNGSWGNDDPSVFSMTVFGKMRGEYQVTNGYGGLRAPAIMRAHWASFIVEDDFKFIKDNGLNAVRIPVGWWIASDPSPPSPYVGGSLAVLDNAFSWADKYGLKVIIDLHAAPGSQNGDEHSGGRDGYIEWGSGNTMAQTVAVIDFLAQRYAKRPSLIAVELINEPRAEGVSFDTLKNYYQAGYDAVRKHTSSAYVIFSSRLSADAGEFISFAGGLDRTVLDVHYYNLFSSFYDGWTPQRHIDYVNTERSQQLSAVTRANGGPLSFVGEWVAEWNVPNASPEDFQRFAKAQLDLFGKATFGWAYWTYKNVNNHWSLKWMITNGYISLL